MVSIEAREFESGLGMMTEELVMDAWRTMPLAQKAFPSGETYVERMKVLHEGLHTVQIAAKDEQGVTLGGIVMTPQESPIVGWCMVILHNYLRGDARGSLKVQARLLGEAKRICRVNDFKWLVVPHMRPTGQFVTYKEI